MAGAIKTDPKIEEQWLFVYVCGPEGQQSYFGLHDDEKGVDFIPAFRTKEEANDCFLTMPREKGQKYQVQAVHIEELEAEAARNNFLVAILDEDGKLVKK